MLYANAEEEWSKWRAGMLIPYSCKTLWKVEELFLEDEKIVFALKSLYFFTLDSFFDAEGSVYDYSDSDSVILGKEGTCAFLTFKLDAFLDAGELGEAK